MKLGYIGLGKMGFSMVERLLEKGHEVVVYDLNEEIVKEIVMRGARRAGSLRDMTSDLPPPRLVWIMVPYQAVDVTLNNIVTFLGKGDTVIDGGNSPYKHSLRRAQELEQRGMDFLDAGVSGGPEGARKGACIMVGGRREVYEKHEGLLRDLAAEHGCLYAGKSGAGHFVKMVHNGMEYGMMQALAEGFSILRASSFSLDVAAIADLFDHRSVIESRLVRWLKEAYELNGPDLDGISGSAAHTGEGMWSLEAARELGVSVPIIQASVDFRLLSQSRPSYAGKIISALRHQFGGHEVAEKSGGKGGAEING